MGRRRCRGSSGCSPPYASSKKEAGDAKQEGERQRVREAEEEERRQLGEQRAAEEARRQRERAEKESRDAFQRQENA